jgi:hypothetical protein
MELTEAEKALILEQRRLELMADSSAEKVTEVPAAAVQAVEEAPEETAELVAELKAENQELKAEIITVTESSPEQKAEVIEQKVADLKPEPEAVQEAESEATISKTESPKRKRSALERAFGFR